MTQLLIWFPLGCAFSLAFSILLGKWIKAGQHSPGAWVQPDPPSGQVLSMQEWLKQNYPQDSLILNDPHEDHVHWCCDSCRDGADE